MRIPQFWLYTKISLPHLIINTTDTMILLPKGTIPPSTSHFLSAKSFIFCGRISKHTWCTSALVVNAGIFFHISKYAKARCQNAFTPVTCKAPAKDNLWCFANVMLFVESKKATIPVIRNKLALKKIGRRRPDRTYDIYHFLERSDICKSGGERRSNKKKKKCEVASL